MGRKDDKGSRPSGARSSPRRQVEAVEPIEPGALARELRDLHDSYGAGGDIPEHLVELARQVADAHARLDLEAAAGNPQSPKKDGGR